MWPREEPLCFPECAFSKQVQTQCKLKQPSDVLMYGVSRMKQMNGKDVWACDCTNQNDVNIWTALLPPASQAKYLWIYLFGYCWVCINPTSQQHASAIPWPFLDMAVSSQQSRIHDTFCKLLFCPEYWYEWNFQSRSSYQGHLLFNNISSHPATRQ